MRAANLIRLTQPLSQRLRRGFASLTIRGFRAVAPRPNGDAGKIVREFAPMTEQVLFIPRLHGG